MIVDAGGFDERTARWFYKQFITGLNYLHEEVGFAHKDLKGENVLLSGGIIKIIDFGMARPVDENDDEYSGTTGY